MSSVSPPAQSAISLVHHAHELLGAVRRRALAHQLGEPLVAVHLAGAARLDQPVRVGEEHLAVIEGQLGLLELGGNRHAERQVASSRGA